MLDLVILICRYIFILIASLFIWESGVYFYNERKLPGAGLGSGIVKSNASAAIAKQRIGIIVFLLISFTILSVDRQNNTFKIDALLDSAGVLIFTVTAMYTSQKIFRNSCPLMWNGVFFIASIGFVMLERLNPDLLRRQLLFCLAGYAFALLIPVAFKVTRKFEKLEYFYLAAGLVMLILVFIPGLGSEEFGASNWVKIGSFSFQPSEFVKVFYVFYLASTFAKYGGLFTPRTIIAAVSCAMIIIILVIQKDLGGALMFFMTFLMLFYASAGKPLITLLAFIVASGASVLAYYIFPHIRVRFSAWLNPWADIDNTGYQVTQSLFAITTYGAIGSGLTRGMSKTVPVIERDMVFAAVCEEFGGVFGILLIAVYGIVLYRGIRAALKCDKRAYSLLCMGITGLFAFQTFIIIGGVTKLIPLTGITLPFISYGGSSIFVSVFLIGVLQWLYANGTADIGQS